MFYVYVIEDEGEKIYIGYSADLKSRLRCHNEGFNGSTRGRRWKLIYYEAYRTEKLARQREKQLKHHGKAKQALLKRLRDENH